MPAVFLATLGQRPEAITIALDVLLLRYAFTRIGILHTEPRYSGIASAYHQLKTVLAQDYPNLSAVYHEICYPTGEPLLDITNQHSAEAYYLGVLQILRDYRIQGDTMHLLIAGGRKAMSIYATLAASLVFGGLDFVWTVLSSSDVMQPDLYHIPPGYQADVQLVRLPILPSRFFRGTLAEMDMESLMQRHRNPREHFLAALTEQEMQLVEVLTQHPHATNERLAEVLRKSAKTVEHQFRSVYRKLERFYDVFNTHKRQMLLDILKEGE